MTSVSYATLADVRLNVDEDIYSEPCWGDHTYERQDSYGRWYTVNGPCTCDVVPTGIVISVRPFAVRTTSSEIDDLPF